MFVGGRLLAPDDTQIVDRGAQTYLRGNGRRARFELIGQSA